MSFSVNCKNTWNDNSNDLSLWLAEAGAREKSDKISCLVPTVLLLSATKSEHIDVYVLKKLQMFWFV